MSINHRRESLLTLKEAANKFPGREPGTNLTYETMRQWIERGRKGVHLESITVGGTRYTSEEAIDRIIARLNERHPAPMSLRQQRARRRRLDGELRELGVIKEKP